jgi:phosphotransferase system HPr-like phosphotransfer protein
MGKRLKTECGTRLDIVAYGPDAEEAVAPLTHLIDAGFDGSSGRAAAASA